MSRRIQIIISVVILLAALGALGLYLVKRPNTEVPEDSYAIVDYPPGLFELTIVDDSAPPEKIESWKQRFATDADAVIKAPDGFNFASVLDMGLIKRNVGDFRGAESAWVYLGQKRPANSISFYNLGNLYAHDLKDIGKAEVAYLKSIENEKKDINYYIALSELYRYQMPEKAEVAGQVLEDGIRENPDSANLLKFSASYFSETGNPEKAIVYYTRALELEPANDAIRDEIKRLEEDGKE